MLTYTLNFNDSHFTKKYFDSELINRIRIMKSVSVIISLMFMPAIVISFIQGDTLLSLSIFLWIAFHWVNLMIIKKYDFWLDYSQFINLLIALGILFQFSHQDQLKEFESAIYGFAFQTYSSALLMIGTNYLIDCLGQIIITFGFFLVLNLRISMTNCIILFFSVLVLCLLKYHIEKAKRTLFFSNHNQKVLGQSVRDSMPSAMIDIRYRHKQNTLEFFAQNEMFQRLSFGVKDNATLNDFTNNLQIKKENQKVYDKAEDVSCWETYSKQQYVSLSQFLSQYCSLLYKKDSYMRSQKNTLFYLLDSQFGIVDCEKIIKNHVEEFVAVFQINISSSSSMNPSQSSKNASTPSQKQYKLRITCSIYFLFIYINLHKYIIYNGYLY